MCINVRRKMQGLAKFSGIYKLHFCNKGTLHFHGATFVVCETRTFGLIGACNRAQYAKIAMLSRVFAADWPESLLLNVNVPIKMRALYNFMIAHNTAKNKRTRICKNPKEHFAPAKLD
jgi:hypothetical protein